MEFNTFWMYNYFISFLGSPLLKVYKGPFFKEHLFVCNVQHWLEMIALKTHYYTYQRIIIQLNGHYNEENITESLTASFSLLNYA